MYIPKDIIKLIESFCIKCYFCKKIKSNCQLKYEIEDINLKHIFCCTDCFNYRTYPIINKIAKIPYIITYPNE